MNQSNNIQLNAKEFEDFDAIMKFIVEVTLDEDPDKFSKDAYYEAYGSHLGKLSAGTVRNQIKNSRLKYPFISAKSYDFFIEAFNKIEIGLLKDGKPTKYSIYKKKFTDLRKKLDARIKSGNFLYEAENKKPGAANKKKIVTEEDNYLNIFQGSVWYCYERDDNDKISRKVLQFGTLDPSGTCPVDHTISEKGMEKWKGQAQFISGESLLVITMVNSRSKLDYTHFLIKVDNRSNGLELCIGHKTFRNNENDNVVTKTVVLTLCSKESGASTAKRFGLNDDTVPPQIRAFLFERHRNRLSSPQ